MPLRLLAIFLTNLLLFFTIVSCSNKPNQVSRGYFFWRSGAPRSNELRFLKEKHIQKLYSRILDVDWSETQGAIPIASSDIESVKKEIQYHGITNLQIVPVIFITNKTMERIDSTDLPLLAKRILRRCFTNFDAEDRDTEKKLGRTSIVHTNEIQIDCDWTRNTSKRYFQLLREIKALMPADSIKLSATIRLHQFKYPEKTGVPPVDRGMLMVYNLSDPKNLQGGNSIFEEEKAAAYFNSSKKYQLPLDIALPAWSWCIVFRNGAFYQIENGLDEKDLKDLSFLQQNEKGIYEVTQDTVYRDLFLRPGDEIKAENISATALLASARIARKAINTNDFTVSLFELSEKEINNYDQQTLDQVYDTFR